MKRGKKGISPVVGTVLILLLTVAVVAIISAFVVPFVRENLTEGQECYDSIASVTFYETPYNCYASGDDYNYTAFSVKVEKEVAGFGAGLLIKGSSDAFEVREGVLNSNLRMLTGDFGEALEVPDKGGVRTYVYRSVGQPDSIEMYPILISGKECTEKETIRIQRCSDPEIVSEISNIA